MYNILKNPDKTIHLNNSSNNDDYTLIDLLPATNSSKAAEEPTMKNELKNFLKKDSKNTLNNQQHGTALSSNKKDK